jgi:hypothetical protein
MRLRPESWVESMQKQPVILTNYRITALPHYRISPFIFPTFALLLNLKYLDFYIHVKCF